MPAHFKQQIRQLRASDPGAYGRAVDNIEKDLWHAHDQPHGNINEQAQQSLENQCNGAASCDAFDVQAVIQAHRSYCQQAGCQPRSRPNGPLRTFMGETILLRYFANREFQKWKNLLDVTGKGTEEIEPLSFAEQPSTSESLAWWTFGPPPPADARAYAEELALPNATIDGIGDDGGGYEIAVAADPMPEALYKPSALDGFCADTKFSPDLTGAAHGMTAPADPSRHQPRPELVSQVFSFHRLNGQVETVTVTYIRCS